MNEGRETRPPRGALVVVAVGLLATVAAALLSTEAPLSTASLSWAATAPLPDSAPAAIPAGGTARLSGAEIRATEAEGSGYRLYRVAATLTIGAGAVPGRSPVRCAVHVPATRAAAAHTANNRAAYPQPSEGEDLTRQRVPSRVVVEFSAGGAEQAAVGVGDAFAAFANQPGVAVDWAPFRAGRQEWEWRLARHRLTAPLRLGFVSIWRSAATPAARIVCTVGAATVHTAGTLGG